MIYVFDLDGTLCLTDGRDYGAAVPYAERIAKINSLHREGHTIIINTARGSLTGTDWRALTEEQLAEWGVAYDELCVGVKPFGDFYIDDKAVTPRAFFGA